MALIGFSTGAIAKGDFRAALRELEAKEFRAVEISALRDAELPELVRAFSSLDLSEFDYVSVHIPSKFELLGEEEVVHLLHALPRHVPLIAHPDAMSDLTLWERFGPQLCIENMDQRKATGRTLAELEWFASELPESTICLDVGHARQVDRTMSLAATLLLAFRGRIRQIHMSEVTATGDHIPMGFGARSGFRKIAGLFPENVPVILESIVEADEIDREVLAAVEIMKEPEKRFVSEQGQRRLAEARY